MSIHTVKFKYSHKDAEVKFPFSKLCGVSSESLPQQQVNNADLTKEGYKLIWSFKHLLHCSEGWQYKKQNEILKCD
jgi:hypothetical protein